MRIPAERHSPPSQISGGQAHLGGEKSRWVVGIHLGSGAPVQMAIAKSSNSNCSLKYARADGSAKAKTAKAMTAKARKRWRMQMNLSWQRNGSLRVLWRSNFWATTALGLPPDNASDSNVLSRIRHAAATERRLSCLKARNVRRLIQTSQHAVHRIISEEVIRTPGGNLGCVCFRYHQPAAKWTALLPARSQFGEGELPAQARNGPTASDFAYV